MENYEADGDMLKSALINAQRMGENVIREANQKSEEILHRANLHGDDIIRDANELLQKASDRADEIINEANEKKLAEEREYDRVRLEVTRFKSDVLNLYRSHVESLSRLPEFQKEEPAEAEPAVEEKPDRGDRTGPAGGRGCPRRGGSCRGRQERGLLGEGREPAQDQARPVSGPCRRGRGRGTRRAGLCRVQGRQVQRVIPSILVN